MRSEAIDLTHPDLSPDRGDEEIPSLEIQERCLELIELPMSVLSAHTIPGDPANSDHFILLAEKSCTRRRLWQEEAEEDAPQRRDSSKNLGSGFQPICE